MSDDRPKKLVFSMPGVCIDKFVGFRRPVFSGPLKGDIGANTVLEPSRPEAVAGRRGGVPVIGRVRFLTLRGLLPDVSARL